MLDRVELIEGDLRDRAQVREAMQGVRYVLHQAALRSVPHSVDDPASTNEVNVQGTLNVLMAAKDAGVQRVVHASSASVYGESHLKIQEEDQRPFPISPYAVSKLAGELYCRMFSRLYGLETVSLRYFNVFGPRQDPESEYAEVIPRFILQALRGEPVEVHGDGLQSRISPSSPTWYRPISSPPRLPTYRARSSTWAAGTHTPSWTSSSSSPSSSGSISSVAGHPLARGTSGARRRISARPSGCWATS